MAHRPLRRLVCPIERGSPKRGFERSRWLGGEVTSHGAIGSYFVDRGAPM